MVEIETSADVYERVADLPSQFTIKIVNEDNYEILDDDDYDIIFVVTGEGDDRTILLPTASVNLGRKIRIMKTDATDKKVIIEGAGSEEIFEGDKVNLTMELTKKAEKLDILCDGTQWWKVNTNDSGSGMLAFVLS